MHDRKREEMDDAKRAQLARKIQAYKALCGQCGALRQRRDYSVPALRVVEKLLEINPEFYTMWNYKKEIVQKLLSDADSARRALHGGCLPDGQMLHEGFPQAPAEAAAAARADIIAREFAFNQRVIERRDQKSYCTWQHRRWLLDACPPAERTALLRRDKALCEQLLREADRNFHCWDYRRWICQQLGWTGAEELVYTRQRVDRNFSNYSAWHQRALLLRQLPEGKERDARVLSELDLVRNAYYTEPQDQSGWIYGLWLVQQASGAAAESAAAALRECAEELAQDDPSLKWPRLCLARLPQQQQQQQGRRELCEGLARDDPLRAGYYRHLAGTGQ
eukprot:TRINITY_DN5419_c2_g1_i1.p1 TRINITY_DN5419_c2_g1~~TRINITY_DN5419_c2_g1_i1.p1  ORF type:complete len:369 (+),score=141.87 TRINITY_DN5419_c2_g1_i1:103-1107(+)